MAISQFRAKRKVSGGRYRDFRKKRKSNLGNLPTLTGLGERKVKEKRVRGGSKKSSLLSCNYINVYDKKTKKYEKAVIKTVLENPANRHYARGNIITKGTILDTEKGKVRVTNRPGQESTLNGVLL